MERYNDLRDRTDKPLIKLRPSSTHLQILDRLQNYDAVPSSYIEALFESPSYVEKCLTQLKKARFVGVPNGYEHINALYRVRPIELWPLGEQALKDAGRFVPRLKGNDHFKHRYLRSIVKFSRDQATKLPGITIHDTSSIWAHSSTPQETKRDRRFASIPVANGYIHPDDFWGIEYRDQHGRRAFMFFHEEDDRGTEPRRSTSASRNKDLRQMIRDYRDYIEANGYRTRYGLPQASVLIHALTSLDTIFDIIVEECSPSTARMFAAKQLPDFIKEPRDLPPPTAHIITEPYFRIEDGSIRPFYILDTLAKVAERKADDRRSEISTAVRIESTA